ncbi:MAG: hypothetical protein COW65_19215, partial [Cytophagales bacterium CG18_big_fil_WC_8_21_14_2_50_42_9]
MTKKANDLPSFWFNRKFQLSLLLIISSLTLFLNLTYGELSLMEARNFIAAREITENGNWLIPTMNGQVRLAKPPLPTWLTVLSGLAAGNIENIVALRFPAACMALLLVFFLYFMASQLCTDNLIPFLSALVLSSSLQFVVVGREGTWDIYCHSFMLGSIWIFVKAIRRHQVSYRLFFFSGFLAGLSFLSKGPVSFYALLLPFLAAYGLSYGLQDFKNKGQGLVAAIIICIVVSVAWPIYIYIMEPVSLTQNVTNESTAWINRHVKPVWYYWGFAFQSGIWALFALASLVVPYAKTRINQFGNYKFLVWWIVFTFILLSVIPEKKERYLLPILIPLAFLIAHYLRYQLESFLKRTFTRWDFGLAAFTFMIIAFATFAFPIIIYFFAFRQLLISGLLLGYLTLFFWAFAALLIYFFFKKEFINLYIVVVLVHVLVVITVIPLYQDILYPADNFQSLSKVRNIKEIKDLPLYALNGIPLEQVWKVGKTVDTLNIINQQVKPFPKLPAAIFSSEQLDPYFPAGYIRFKKIETFHYSRKEPDKTLYLFKA